jgi:hypothetical protein
MTSRLMDAAGWTGEARPFSTSIAVAGLTIFCLLATTSTVRAENTRCVSALGNQIVLGDLVVPDGASCALRDATVRGSVLVGPHAGLRVLGNVRILGDVRIDRCDYASFEPPAAAGPIFVEGNVEIEHCEGSTGKLYTAGTVRISGNFTCHDNTAPCFAVALSIYGDALVSGNSGGISFIEGSRIIGKLECAGNLGVSNYGDPNRVAGKKLGQCAGL